MKPGANNERVYRMAFASVDPHYVIKLERKGRTKEGRCHHPLAYGVLPEYPVRQY